MTHLRPKKLALVGILLSVAVSLCLSDAFADSRGRDEGKLPPGHSKGEKKGWEGGQPPGWTKGEKRGWDSALPPGLEKKASAEEREAFEAELGAAEEAVRKKAKGRGLAKEAIEDVAVSLNLAARNGAPVGETADVVEAMVDHGQGPEDIGRATKALAYGASEEVDLRGMGGHVKELLQAGLRGDDLSLAIYEELERRRQAGGQPSQREK